MRTLRVALEGEVSCLKRSGWLVCALLLPLMLVSPALSSGVFDLRVNDVSGLDEPWPLMGGLPFPEGELRDASQIRIVGADGQEVPAQIDVTATWKDGSIRWALAGFAGSPQGEYRVEFGEGVSRREPERPLRIEEANGRLAIDTGEAVYEFLPDRLLPESARMGDTSILAGSGDGAYLVDNRGRLSRVAGELAEVETEILKQGPARVVVRREGWYVTDDGERVARAKAWFYLTAGSPHLRVTHTLVFTEDTNDLWVRDYGLEFRTPDSPREAAFAMGDAERSPRELLSMRPVEVAEVFSAPLDGDELYMLQDEYPHYLETDARALVGRAAATRDRAAAAGQSYWTHDWLGTAPAVGDWADGTWDDLGLTVVMPWLAQRFPKEIAFGPDGARVAFWSGRSGRELDFRAVTLVNEYWQTWTLRTALGGREHDRTERAADLLAAHPSNAQAAARTHDVWLLPRAGAASEQALRARAAAASQPPLIVADPVWLCATEAMNWPMHHQDTERFPREEEVISEIWHDMVLPHKESLRLNGFIAWGGNPYIRGVGSYHFRVSNLVDYGLRKHVWVLYARSGERSQYDYGTRFNRFAGDWTVAHDTAGEKFKGGFVRGNTNLPFYWGESGYIRGGVTGHDIVNWLHEYYLTGDEYPLHITHLIGEAFREHMDQERYPTYDGAQGTLGVMVNLYKREWDEDFRRMAKHYVDYLIDLDHPFGLNDNVRFGMYYKVGRKVLALYDYYRATGDERAKEAFLRASYEKFRYYQPLRSSMGGRGAFGGQNYITFQFAIAYRLSGNPAFLRMVNRLVEDHRRGPDSPFGAMAAHLSMNPFMGVPAGLAVLAEAEEPIEPFPTLETDDPRPILVRKVGGEAVNLSIYVRMSDDVNPNAEPSMRVASLAPRREAFPDAAVEKAQMSPTIGTRQDPRRWHFYVTLPADAPAGRYALEFPGAGTVIVLESDAPEIALGEQAQ